MKMFLPLLLFAWLLSPSIGVAAPDPDRGPYHFVIVMPADIVYEYERAKEAYEGVEFPLFCGIASVYPKENKFVFTKMTNLPLRWLELWLQPIEQEGYLHLYGHPPYSLPVNDSDFFMIFMNWMDSRSFKAYHVSSGREVPLKVVPRFKRTCPYNSKKNPPTDCAYKIWDITDLYIPFTDEEIRQIEKDNAK